MAVSWQQLDAVQHTAWHQIWTAFKLEWLSNEAAAKITTKMTDLTLNHSIFKRHVAGNVSESFNF